MPSIDYCILIRAEPANQKFILDWLTSRVREIPDGIICLRHGIGLEDLPKVYRENRNIVGYYEATKRSERTTKKLELPTIMAVFSVDKDLAEFTYRYIRAHFPGTAETFTVSYD